MILSQTRGSTTAVVTETAMLWNMPWHARLKNLAEALRPDAAQVRKTPGGSVHSWLERVRLTS